MTEATLHALDGLRDFSMIKWYVIPLLALVFYVYNKEIRLARNTGNWNAVLAGATIFGMDFFNETWNGWVLVLTQRSAFWTTPGDTALRTTVGWNIEIMFMFAILGIIYYYALSESTTEKILGIPEKWFWAVTYSIFCVFVECLLNYGGHLVWEYPWWHRTFEGIWLIFFFGYFHFFVAALIVISLKTLRNKLITVSVIYAVPIVMNVLAFGVFGWNY
ncbi:MAG: hypothetical protein COX19_06150 [Desulfobacterales bacterium CG23_combo_of_CG06-09_8_20_14_all_51_8]|nr:MAG: hypothetical protein COX19_06150 [Desulfobacterales bacterium CG23_combo_of_CG06-09_8_20_14_all_51_8]